MKYIKRAPYWATFLQKVIELKYFEDTADKDLSNFSVNSLY